MKAYCQNHHPVQGAIEHGGLFIIFDICDEILEEDDKTKTSFPRYTRNRLCVIIAWEISNV